MLDEAKYCKHVAKLSLHKVLVEVTHNDEMFTEVLEEQGIQVGD